MREYEKAKRQFPLSLNHKIMIIHHGFSYIHTRM